MAKTVKINGVWPMVLPDSSADEWIGNMEHHQNKWEMPRLQALKADIDRILANNATPTVMYIGAYKGDMAALLASWGAELVVMESSPGFWPLIKETWDLNPSIPQPIGFFSGLLSKQTTVDFDREYLTKWPERTEDYREGHTGFTHLAEAGGVFPEITIDDFIARTGIKPDIITMDVEGSELEILKGAMHTIENLHPIFMLSIHPEFMFHNHGTYERELHDLLRNRKYQEKWLDYDHEHHWRYEWKGDL